MESGLNGQSLKTKKKCTIYAGYKSNFTPGKQTGNLSDFKVGKKVSPRAIKIAN